MQEESSELEALKMQREKMNEEQKQLSEKHAYYFGNLMRMTNEFAFYDINATALYPDAYYGTNTIHYIRCLKDVYMIKLKLCKVKLRSLDRSIEELKKKMKGNK